MARTFIYSFLANAFSYPVESTWQWLCDSKVHAIMKIVTNLLSASDSPLQSALARMHPLLQVESFDSFVGNYLVAFGHAARGSCPVNEIEYGDLKADPLFQPHRLADLGGFYQAFGLELPDDAAERQDHIAVELEFLSVLAAKEAFLLDHPMETEGLELVRAAQKQFLSEHLGRWTPAFTRRLAGALGEGALCALADFTRLFVEEECGRFGLKAGSEELALRPVDEASESICSSCGLASA